MPELIGWQEVAQWDTVTCGERPRPFCPTAAPGVHHTPRFRSRAPALRRFGIHSAHRGLLCLTLTPLDTAYRIHYRMVVDNLSLAFGALSDPTRRAMVHELTRGPATIHALTQPFALSQQMISKHVACLVRARIVVKQKRGRESVCTLSPAAIKAVADWAFDFRRLWDESLDKLDAVLQEMKSEETSHARKSRVRLRPIGSRQPRQRRQ